MAAKRFPVEQYATLELNQVAFPKTGMVVSQTPLGEKFVEGGSGNYGVCENGMWVVADKAKGAAATSSTLFAPALNTMYLPSEFFTILQICVVDEEL